jgi:hypothetical protein
MTNPLNQTIFKKTSILQAFSQNVTKVTITLTKTKTENTKLFY